MDFPIILENKLFPVQAFFNAMPGISLIRTLESFCNRIGAGFNDATCEFPEEVESGDDYFDGVRFSIFNEEVIISNEVFFDILSQVCSIYISKNKDSSEEISSLMKIIKDNLY
ncbi:ribonuclease toxin immunity protein CdiI [Delftia acidovorans]|uniref:ribonuclease toxin immunity protein CdiI n=1 Tax=Delftia acidovorans TaxID=80866 RepID=UPI0012FD64C9|nr:ribonuclease toxin immunity protein CdiI [Delftia acidovorans]